MLLWLLEVLSVEEHLEADGHNDGQPHEKLVRQQREVDTERVQVGFPERQQRDRATRAAREPANRLRSDGRRLLEGGGRLQNGEGDFRAAAVPPHDLYYAAPQDKERHAGFPFLEDVLAVVVVALVDDAGETPEVQATKVFEEGHLFEEVHQAAAFLGRRRFRRRSEQRPCWSC